MKKLINVLSIIILCIVSVIVLVGCACDSRIDKIKVGCLTDDDEFEILVKSKHIESAGLITYFDYSGDIESLASEIKNQDNKGSKVNVHCYGRFVFIVKTTLADNRKHLYNAIKLPNGRYALQSAFSGADGNFFYAPIHYLNWGKEEMYFDKIDGKMQLNVSAQEFVDFYKLIDVYNVRVQDDKIFIDIISSKIAEKSVHTTKNFYILLHKEADKTSVEFKFE